eukprot:3312510-Rhodomonas_salina.1
MSSKWRKSTGFFAFSRVNGTSYGVDKSVWVSRTRKNAKVGVNICLEDANFGFCVRVAKFAVCFDVRPGRIYRFAEFAANPSSQ